MRAIKPIDPESHLLKPKLRQTKTDLEGDLKVELAVKKEEKVHKLTDEMILKMDKCCYNDFDLLEGIPTPKCCNNLMNPKDADLLMKQRKFYMLEMERFSKELVAAMNEM